MTKLVGLGDLARARCELQVLAADDFQSTRDDQASLFVLMRLSQAAVALDARPEAERLYAVLTPYAYFNAVSASLLCLGSISQALGWLARYLGERARAQAHFEDALDAHLRMGYQSRAAHTRLELAKLLACVGAQQRRTRRLAQQTLCDAQRLGLHEVAEQAARLL